MEISRLYKLLLFGSTFIVILISANLKNSKKNINEFNQQICTNWFLRDGIGISEKGGIFINGIEVTPWYASMNITFYEDFTYVSSSKNGNLFKNNGSWKISEYQNGEMVLELDEEIKLIIDNIDVGELNIRLDFEQLHSSNISDTYVISLIGVSKYKGYSTGAIQ